MPFRTLPARDAAGARLAAALDACQRMTAHAAPRRRGRRLIVLAVAIVLAGCSVNDLLLNPEEARDTQAADPVDPAANGDVARKITVENRAGNKLVGWLFSARGDRGIVLAAGGNGTGTPHTYAYNRFLLHHGFRVLVFSYQGFDQNEGVADIGSIAGDVEAFHSYAARQFPGEPIGFVGESIGAIAGLCGAAGDYAVMSLEGLIDPSSIAYTIIDSYVPAPLSYVLSFTFHPGAVLYEAAVPGELNARDCAARNERTAMLFLNQRKDPVSSLALVRELARAHPAHITVLELPDSAAHPHLVVSHSREAQARIVAFIKTHLKTQAADRPARKPSAPGGHAASRVAIVD